jgi:hypothetical protein
MLSARASKAASLHVARVLAGIRDLPALKVFFFFFFFFVLKNSSYEFQD